MGSGKGKTRRVRALARSRRVAAVYQCTAGTLKYNPEKWQGFVDAAGTDYVNAHSYYLDYVPKKELVAAEYEKILNGLFSDGVEVGAVVLPDGYVAENFEFKIETFSVNRINGVFPHTVARVTLKGNAEGKGDVDFGHFRSRVGSNNPALGSDVAVDALDFIVHGVAQLLDELPPVA